MNIRSPRNINPAFLMVQDVYLKEEIINKGITDIDDLKPLLKGIYLWKGDITTLRCDAIVNVANSGLTGCYLPNHQCVDNCIHSFARIQLRLACVDIMKRQGSGEPTGRAEITKGYNLPPNLYTARFMN